MGKHSSVALILEAVKLGLILLPILYSFFKSTSYSFHRAMFLMGPRKWLLAQMLHSQSANCLKWISVAIIGGVDDVHNTVSVKSFAVRLSSEVKNNEQYISAVPEVSRYFPRK